MHRAILEPVLGHSDAVPVLEVKNRHRSRRVRTTATGKRLRKRRWACPIIDIEIAVVPAAIPTTTAVPIPKAAVDESSNKEAIRNKRLPEVSAMVAVIKQTDRAKRGDASNPVRPGGPGIAAGGPTHVPTSAQVAAPAEVTSAHVPATSAVLRVRERRQRQSKQE